MSGGSTPGANTQLNPYWFSQLGSAQQGVQGLGQYNLGAQFSPDVTGIAQGYLQNPYAQGGQGAANQFAPMGTNAALQAIQNAGGLGGTVNPLISAGYGLMGMGFDPQQDYYNRLMNDTQQRTLANLSQAGTATTPYGQSVLGNVLGNTNIDWQNQLLQRALAGTSGASNAFQGAGTMGAGALGLGMGGVGAGVQSGFLPSTAYQQILAGQLMGPQAAAGFGNQISAIPTTQAQLQQGLMSGIQGEQGVLNQQQQLEQQAQQQQFNQMMQEAQGVGQMAGMFFGMPPGGGGFKPGGGMFGGGGAQTGWNTTPGLSPFQQLGNAFGWFGSPIYGGSQQAIY